MKVIVPVRRVVDFNVKARVKGDGTSVDIGNMKMSMNPFGETAVEEAMRQTPADLASAPAAIVSDAMADLVEAPQFLDVNVPQLARMVALVAPDRFVGRRSLRGDGPARRGTRLTVALETPMYAAMRACKSTLRRS